jgi:hypothetical protein
LFKFPRLDGAAVAPKSSRTGYEVTTRYEEEHR